MTTPVWLDSFNTKVAPQGAWTVSAGRLFQSVIAVEWEGCWTSEHWRQVSVSVWSLKGRERAIIRRTLGVLQRRRWGNFWETGWSAYGLFRAHIYHVVLNSVWYVASSKFGIRIKGVGAGGAMLGSFVNSICRVLLCLWSTVGVPGLSPWPGQLWLCKARPGALAFVAVQDTVSSEAKHVVNTVGLLILFYFFKSQNARHVCGHLRFSRYPFSVCVDPRLWTDIPGVVEPGCQVFPCEDGSSVCLRNNAVDALVELRVVVT